MMPTSKIQPGKRPENILRFLFCIFSLVAGESTIAQKKALTYDVIRNGNKVGTVNFIQSTSAETDSLKLESKITARLITTFVVTAREHAVFNKGILSESSIYRQLNGKEKANKKHKADNGRYIISGGKNSSASKIYPITYTMLSLYTKEPSSTSKVYSDNFELLLDIEKTEEHKYKISLPDDSYNYYIYRGGVLSQVEIHGNLFSAKFVLVNM